MTAEHQRLADAKDRFVPWRAWGPYLTERQWGTVREDYSARGDAWNYVSHEAARSKAYRWGEEGIAGISDDQQQLCFALAFWNERDPFLKERLFGLTNPEGNHGEDPKECCYYLDNTPTHGYMRMLYKYPQAEFPYARLRAENARRGKADPEFELLDTGLFDQDRYFDCFVEYAKAAPDDLLIRVTVHNRGEEPAPIRVLPTLWLRDTWSWGYDDYQPGLTASGPATVEVNHRALVGWRLHCDELTSQPPELLFCDNRTNARRLYGATTNGGHCKDGINDCVVGGDRSAINPQQEGTKAAAHYALTLAPGASATIRLRLGRGDFAKPFADFDRIFAQCQAEADEFYADIQRDVTDPDARLVQRQALAGMLWSKQFYYYDVHQWLNGDPAQPPPPPQRLEGRNAEWPYLSNADVISMPDKWEYPWYATWDSAFHCLPLALLDPEFAKNQLLLFTREWYMRANGQMPAYEWQFDAANPPVHAWATWRVYKMDEKATGQGDVAFLERIFHKLLLNFTWWVNRQDVRDRNVFQGGFLGLDNIGVFDRGAELPTGGHIEQSDGTSWMAMYSLNLMRIALELCKTNLVYQDLAAKFFEHFLLIADAMTHVGQDGVSHWDDEDSFYYDVLWLPNQQSVTMRVRSLVGLIPLFAVEVLDPDLVNATPAFAARLRWVLDNRPHLARLVSRWQDPGKGERQLLSLLRGHRMKKLLRRMLDESEFLSDYGVRSLSRYHLDHPYELQVGSNLFRVQYVPGESDSNIFGGNSNWRGPVWFPMNYLIIESLQRFHHYYGDDFKVEYPTGSGQYLTLLAIADELSARLTRIFLRGPDGQRAAFGDNQKLQTDPHFRDYLLFHEYFHGDCGAGLGAEHQTGWTGLVAKLLMPRRPNEG